MKKTFGASLLMAGLALLTAPSVSARDIPIQHVTVIWSSISPAPAAGDSITITAGGELWVDQDGTVGKIQVGSTDGTSAGLVLFDGTPRTITVVGGTGGQPGDVTFGPNAGNIFNMAYLNVAHTVKVTGNFLASGNGSFSSGVGTVVYNGSGAQNVTANVNGSVIYYKNLTIAGSGVKTLGNGVNVQGTLSLQGTSTLAGSVPITYGDPSVSSLDYDGSAPQTTTGLEWPPAPSILAVPVTVRSTGGLTLDNSKISSGSLTVTTPLSLNGAILTAKGNIANAGGITGAGTVVLGGSSAQALTGAGHYSNLQLNNAAGATVDPALGVYTEGRLTLTLGRLDLGVAGAPTFTPASHAALLTYNSTDRPLGSYGSTASAAGTQSDTVFADTGILNVPAKPLASFINLTLAPTIQYGDSSITITGQVSGGANGNNAVNGETVTVTLDTATPVTQTTSLTGGNGSFTVTFSTAAVPAGAFNLDFHYAGGINLQSQTSLDASSLTVSQKLIIVTPDNVSKVYNGATGSDPVLTYTYNTSGGPPNSGLVGSDAFSGTLTRTGAGAVGDVGAYAINQGSLTLGANYNLAFITGKALTILTKSIAVTATARSKTYGDSDPVWLGDYTPASFTYTPALVSGDVFTGGLSRDSGNENVGTYPIRQGTLALSANYVLNFTSASFTINQKAITITLNPTPPTKVYGNVDPALTYDHSPALIGADSFTGALARLAGEGVGSYAVNLGTLAAGPNSGANYQLTLTPVNMTITKHGVTISANGHHSVYGTTPNNFVTYSGLLVGNPRVPDQTTTLPGLPTVGNWSPSVPTATSVPGAYTFTVDLSTASDPNYSITSGTLVGTLTIDPAPLSITADNKTKVANGAVFNPANFTVTYSGFVAGDNAGTAFTPGGLLAFTGTAVTATTMGVWDIHPTGLTSTKYNLTWVDGALTITAPIATSTVVGDQTWGPGGNLSWAIDRANGGTAGAEPGWNLLNVTSGALNITATAGSKFTIYLTTQTPGTGAAGLAAQFDPTRPYVWKIAHASGGIGGFAANKFNLVWNGATVPGFFLNPVFGGTFGIQVNPSGPPTEVDITFTPQNPVTDVPSLLASVRSSDVDVLYLLPNNTTLTPQQAITISLNVANLHEPIIGAQAYLAFDSRFFDATTGPNGPVIGAGGGVWDQLIWQMWSTSGQLDTVVGLDFSAVTGTSADGTVANIRLTPTRTATGASRVVFRTDNDVIPGSISGGTLLNALSGANVLPARVMTPDLVITVDSASPVIDSITATQLQYEGSAVPAVNWNVKNGPSSGSDPVYSTNTFRGVVNITVYAHDLPGVGLSGPPTVNLTGPGSPQSATLTSPAGATVGPFTYTWTVDGTTVNGLWTATVTATDTVTYPAPNAPTVQTFTLTVNKNQVTGVVELDSFKGTNRVVTFKSGDGSSVTQTWPLPLSFTNTMFVTNGSFHDLQAFAAELLTPAHAVTYSTYFRYGAINNLPAFVQKVMFSTDGVSAYLRNLWFGEIASQAGLTQMAIQLKNPIREIDNYVFNQLSSTTKAALAAYPTSGTPTAAQVAALETGLLDDFNAIVAGPSIYAPLRFMGILDPADPVGGSPSDSRLAGLAPGPSPTGRNLQLLNRLLLNDAYPDASSPFYSVPPEQYIIGLLNAATTQRLLSYGGGSDTTLTGLILVDLDALTTTSSMWGTPYSPTDYPSYGLGIYSPMTFLGIPLSAATQALLPPNPTPTGTDLTLLNRLLLQDAYALSGGFNYQAGPLTPATAAALATFVATPSQFNQAALDPLLVTDLNAVLSAGTITRSALETSYGSMITKSATLATYTLNGVPDSTTLVSAKTAWNLRATLEPVTSLPDAIANFVNDENVPTRGTGVIFDLTNDHYLRTGDITGDDTINLSDFNILQHTYGSTTDLRADLNGDGLVNILDYNVLHITYGSTGDNEVDGTP
jgi:hypothetical protein